MGAFFLLPIFAQLSDNVELLFIRDKLANFTNLLEISIRWVSVRCRNLDSFIPFTLGLYSLQLDHACLVLLFMMMPCSSLVECPALIPMRWKAGTLMIPLLVSIYLFDKSGFVNIPIVW